MNSLTDQRSKGRRSGEIDLLGNVTIATLCRVFVFVDTKEDHMMIVIENENACIK